jgi:hypothetical protein
MSELVSEKRVKNVTPEEIRERRKYYNSLRTNRTRKTIPVKHCDVCNRDITWDNMNKHIKTKKHIKNAATTN